MLRSSSCSLLFSLNKEQLVFWRVQHCFILCLQRCYASSRQLRACPLVRLSAHSHPPTPTAVRLSPLQRLSKRVKFIRDIVREVAGQAPYERRVLELLKVGKDKRALKVCKKKLGTHIRAKRKREEMSNLLRKMKK